MVDDGAVCGRLRFDADRVRRFTTIEPRVISIHHLLRPERVRVEAFLDRAYARAFGGRIRSHYPTLMSLQDRAGRIHAAAGFRLAGQGQLFLEQYLDSPVEQALAPDRAGVARRDQIAEIGNLASDSRGASVFLFLALARHLDRQGCTHAVATATRQLRRSFARVGFATRRLAAADPRRLAETAADWGSYYQCDPEVHAGAIAPALPALASLLLAEPAPTVPAWPRLHPAISVGAAQ